MKNMWRSTRDVCKFWFSLLIIIILSLGIFFRFVNLDRKVYWLDETYTSLWLSGHSRQELIQPNFGNRLITVQDLYRYQGPNSEYNVIDTIERLAQEDPQHPPLFYIFAYFWMQIFGNSVAVIRSLSALFGVLTIPCFYWLCLELFSVPTIALMASSLMAVSPVNVLFAQDAREYSLWILTTLLSTIYLLKAIRSKTKLNWIFYGLTLSISYYTYLLTALIALGHGIYIVIIEKLKFNKTIIAYFLTSSIATVSFIPWIATIHQVDAANWTAVKLPQLMLYKSWFLSLSRVFVDLHHEGGIIKLNINNYLDETLRSILVALLIFLIISSIIYLYRHTAIETWLMVLIFIAIPIVFMVLPDLILGGQRSAVTRYLIPLYLGIEITIAYLLASKISVVSLHNQSKIFWQSIAIFLLSLGIISCIVNSQAEIWWNKSPSGSKHVPVMAQIINPLDRPLLITESDPFDLLNLVNKLKATVAIQFISQGNIPPITSQFSDIFIYEPSQLTIDRLKQRKDITVQKVSKVGLKYLWQLKFN